jgi:hypothetical protein
MFLYRSALLVGEKHDAGRSTIAYHHPSLDEGVIT